MTQVDVNIVSSTRVFSNVDAHRKATRTLLSVVDAACANFTPTGALWYFEPAKNQACLDIHRLKDSLSHTIKSFPHFGGRLRRVHQYGLEPRESGKAFYNRIEVVYGDQRAPGVQFDVATTNVTIEDIVPSADKQARNQVWQATDLARETVFLQGPLANAMTAPLEVDELTHESEAVPSAVVQVTSLLGDGMVIGVKISHPLGDAHALALFVRAWSNNHAELVSRGSLADSIPKVFPFVPELVNRIATRIADKNGREDTMKKALVAPMHRFDWWDNKDAPFQSVAMRAPDILSNRPEANASLVGGKKMNWKEWDQSAGVEHTVLRFSHIELESLRRSAKSGRVSTLDILIAHIWSAINRARGFSRETEDSRVYADISFGLRGRLEPPLPDDFIGSPLANMAVPMKGHHACSTSDVPAMASSIRQTVNTLTPELLAAHIFGLTQELTPQRVWQCFLGKRHILVTSWVHTGVFEVDFGTGQAPRYVHPIMPMIDGCIQIIEGTPLTKTGERSEKWYGNGVNVNVYLEANATAKLLKDPDLHPSVR